MTKHSHCRGGCSFLLLFLIIFPLILVSSVARGEEADDRGGEKAAERGPSLIERAIGITGEGLNSRWDQLKTWAKMRWMNLHPPDAGFGTGGSSAEVAKEAATRSFETSKETAEQAAVSAAKAAGEAVEKTKEKLKRTVSGGDPHGEL